MTVADPPVDRDIASIQWDEWPTRPLGVFLGLRENRFQVVFRQSVLDEMHLHGQGSNDIEVCGVLIGAGYRDTQGPYLLVEHCIRGNGARTKATNVTFTAETWAHIQGVMDEKHADKKMIGWYHTHPGFGIFLSDMDIFICDNFFNLPWQIAFVYDPISGDEGNFSWRAGRPTREPVLIEEDVTPASAAIPLMSKQEAMTARDVTDPTITDANVIELLVRVRRLERRQKVTITAMVFLAAFVIMWTLLFSPVATSNAIKPATQITPQTTSPIMSRTKPPGAVQTESSKPSSLRLVPELPGPALPQPLPGARPAIVPGVHP